MPSVSNASSGSTPTFATPSSFLADRVTPWSDEPVFPLGPLKFTPEDDVLCMVCVSAGNMNTVQETLDTVQRLVAMQGARGWVQFYDNHRKGDVQEAGPDLLGWTHKGGGSNLLECLRATLATLPLPNGRSPTHLVLAFNGHDAPLVPPTLNGTALPTTLVLPPSTPDVEWAEKRAAWRKTPGAAPVFCFKRPWVHALAVEIEETQLRQALREQDDRWGTTRPSRGSSRPRL